MNDLEQYIDENIEYHKTITGNTYHYSIKDKRSRLVFNSSPPSTIALLSYNTIFTEECKLNIERIIRNYNVVVIKSPVICMTYDDYSTRNLQVGAFYSNNFDCSDKNYIFFVYYIDPKIIRYFKLNKNELPIKIKENILDRKKKLNKILE